MVIWKCPSNFTKLDIYPFIIVVKPITFNSHISSICYSTDNYLKNSILRMAL